MSKNEDQDQNDQDTCEGRFIATVSSSSSSRSRNSRTQDLPLHCQLPFKSAYSSVDCLYLL
jgi:hypothetical protein